MTPDECRAYTDAAVPRLERDGWTINAQHVAIEQTLRVQHGHPSYIPELDGPGCYRELPGPGELIQIGVTPDSYAWEISADGHVIRWIRSPSELGQVVDHETEIKFSGPPTYTSWMGGPEWVGPTIEFTKLDWDAWYEGGGYDVRPQGYIPGS